MKISSKMHGMAIDMMVFVLLIVGSGAACIAKLD